MAEFAKYAFNKSHAACYAVVAYRTAYLKTYYPAEFMAATLNSFLGNLDKIPEYIDECKRIKIEILKPDINLSYENFIVENDKIRYGLGSIKNVGTIPVQNIVKEREKNGKYKNFIDFLERIDGLQVNKKCVESLIKAGVFDEFKETRATLLNSFEDIIDSIQSNNKKELSGQVSMFDIGNKNDDISKQKYSFNVVDEYDEKQLLSMEKEMLGIYISGHPLDKYRNLILKNTNISSKDLRGLEEQSNENENDENIELIENVRSKFKDGQNVKCAGIITSIKKKYTKNNKMMAFITIEDLYGTIEVIAFENVVLKYASYLIEENIIMIEGRLSIREDEKPTIIANSITDFKEQKQAKNVFSIDITDFTESQKNKLRNAIRYFNGNRNNMNIEVIVNGEEKPCGQIYFNEDVKKIFDEIKERR